jgi:hypothetical protein
LLLEKIETPREITVPKTLDFTDSAYRKKLRFLVAAPCAHPLDRERPRPPLGSQLTTIRRAELTPSMTALTRANDQAIRRALEQAGVEFIDDEKGGPGVRLRGALPHT